MPPSTDSPSLSADLDQTGPRQTRHHQMVVTTGSLRQGHRLTTSLT